MRQWTYIFIKFNFDTICKLPTSRFCLVSRKSICRVTRRLEGLVGPETSVDALENRKLSHCGQSKIRPALFHPLA